MNGPRRVVFANKSKRRIHVIMEPEGHYIYLESDERCYVENSVDESDEFTVVVESSERMVLWTDTSKTVVQDGVEIM